MRALQTLTSLGDTIAKLALRRQTEKIKVYIALRRILSAAMLVMFILTGVALLTDRGTCAPPAAVLDSTRTHHECVRGPGDANS